MKVARGFLVLVAVAFGLLTIAAGGRVLLGADPGYAAYRPLLLYNTAMGLAYVAAGVAAWLDLRRGKYAAGAIFILNLLVLGAVAWLYRSDGSVAIESVRAMTMRTVVWLALFAGLAWVGRIGAGSARRDD